MSVTTMLKAIKKQDEWMTPDYAVKALLPFLPPKQNILCPFDKKNSAFVRVLSKAGHSVSYTHRDVKGLHGAGFFTYDHTHMKNLAVDFIISNPPYSCKDNVFEHLFLLGRPFCMLMGATAGLFEGKRFNLWQEHAGELSVIWLSPRVSYIDENGITMKSPPFQSCYVCWKLNEHPYGHYFMKVEK